jgi:hypothetical protein
MLLLVWLRGSGILWLLSIRLFNKQLGKGGQSIENLPELCAMELREITLMIHDHTQETEGLIQTLNAVLDYSTATTNSEVPTDSVKSK